MKILFSFVDNGNQSESINILVDGCNPEDFSETFNGIYSYEKIGQVLFSFIRILKSFWKTTFYQNCDVATIESDYKVCIRFYKANSCRIGVSDSANNSIGSMHTFSALANFFDITVKLSKYIDKVVKFTYDGGTSPGKNRIVKVVSCHGGNDPYITGHDLNGENWKDNYRNYSLSKIINEKIEIIE